MKLLILFYDNSLIYHPNTFFIVVGILLFIFLTLLVFLTIKFILFFLSFYRNLIKVLSKRKSLLKDKKTINKLLSKRLNRGVKIYSALNKKITQIELFFEKIGKIIAKEVFIDE